MEPVISLIVNRRLQIFALHMEASENISGSKRS